MRRVLALLLSASLPAPAGRAGHRHLARGPDRVAVTVYRDPESAAPRRRPISQWLNGVALISETRRVTVPAGTTDIRFEGVAGGIIPQSAIVTGLPEGVIERNRDAYLLSPATLLDRSLGRRVHLRRTSRATGAGARAGGGDPLRRGRRGGAADRRRLRGAALHRPAPRRSPMTACRRACPPARPSRSAPARTRAVTATVTLSYLATGFDWQADYVAHVSPDGTHRPVRLADAGEQRRDRLRQCRHPGGGGPDPPPRPAAPAVARAGRSTSAAGRRTRPATSRSRSGSRLMDDRAAADGSIGYRRQSRRRRAASRRRHRRRRRPPSRCRRSRRSWATSSSTGFPSR